MNRQIKRKESAIYKHCVKNYDAIFITKEYFEEASEREYADIYANIAIPSFIIRSMKSLVLFF